MKVYADSTKGIPFKNPENTSVQVKFKADSSDKWLAIPENFSDPHVPEHAKGYLPARGDLSFKPNTTPCPVPMGSLIVVGKGRECKASGEEGYFELAPDETVYFLMNDVLGNYGDNKGFINVQVSVSKN